MTDELDLREIGRAADGRELALDRRLFMQLRVYRGSENAGALISALEQAKLPGVLYEDLNDPWGVALLTFSEMPDFFTDPLRRFLRQPPFSSLQGKDDHTMMGRTYALGHEDDLEESLIARPRRKVCDPAFPWAIWYPLRRAGSFERLTAEEQRVILMEHGGIGHAFGRAGLGTDIRLACHGLGTEDNDFVVGLLGRELHALSMIVQRMRRTKQTSLHLERLGPFFVGRVVWQKEQAGA